MRRAPEAVLFGHSGSSSGHPVIAEAAARIRAALRQHDEELAAAVITAAPRSSRKKMGQNLDSTCVTREHLEDFATIARIECIVIDATTTPGQFKQDLRNNEVYYHLAQGLRG
mgnify:CR=1 FL=1